MMDRAHEAGLITYFAWPVTGAGSVRYSTITGHANQSNIVANEEELVSTAKEMGFPLVLKTAVEDVYHKSELSGVYLNIDTEEKLRSSYKELQEKLPGNALLAKMVQSEGVEMIVGMTTDQQLGPMVTIGFGGYYAEAMNDAITLMPPFSKEMAKNALSKLKMKTLLHLETEIH